MFGTSIKLHIGSLEPRHEHVKVRAQYNPKELQFDRPVPWVKHNVMDHEKASDRVADARAHRGIMQLEYTGTEPRTTSLELLFDVFESGKTDELARSIALLEQLAMPIDATSSDEAKRRPHFCVVAWGDGMRPFRCVIEGLTVKYTMFDRRGHALRATATVKLKEANRLSTSKSEKEAFSGVTRK